MNALLLPVRAAVYTQLLSHREGAPAQQADVMREIKAVPEAESLRFVFDVPLLEGEAPSAVVPAGSHRKELSILRRPVHDTRMFSSL